MYVCVCVCVCEGGSYSFPILHIHKPFSRITHAMTKISVGVQLHHQRALERISPVITDTNNRVCAASPYISSTNVVSTEFCSFPNSQHILTFNLFINIHVHTSMSHWYWIVEKAQNVPVFLVCSRHGYRSPC